MRRSLSLLCIHCCGAALFLQVRTVDKETDSDSTGYSTISLSKGHLSPMFVKTFFFTASISTIYKSAMIHQSVCRTHFLGSREILFGEEHKDERER